MPSLIPVTAIFDIGKTNKKFLLFDEDYSIVYKTQICLEESEDDDGFPCEDLQQLTRWIWDEFEKVVNQQKFKITGLNFSSYGASLVHMDENGKPVTPLYNYLKPYPQDLAARFYEKYGGKKSFALETASPPMGMLNSGLQLYWLKNHKPAYFQKIKTSLHLPQYLSYLFSSKKSADLTSLGCHTGMWDFREKNYHSWLKNERILNVLPPAQSSQTSWQINLRDQPCKTGIGIHDSSAALAPYILALKKPFIQLSTGTWSIAMNPFTSSPLEYEEIERDCLLYINIYGKPVKASRLLLGGEYSHQLKNMGNYFEENPNQLNMEADPELTQKLANDIHTEKKLVLEKAYDTGPYPKRNSDKWNLSLFESYKEATHQCMLDLASIQVAALRLSEGKDSVDQIIITGGFAKNQFFCRLLAAMLPDKKIYTANTPYASALGAALVLEIDSLKERNVKTMLGLTLQEPFPELKLDHYFWENR